MESKLLSITFLLASIDTKSAVWVALSCTDFWGIC